MSTTSMYVEILVVGLQTLVWLLLLVSLCTKWNLGDGSEALQKYKEYSSLITVLLLASAYVLGILFDRLADTIYSILSHSSGKSQPVSFGEMRLQVMHGSEGMAKFLDYQRSRLRIARATVFNALITIVVGSIWLITYPDSNYASIIESMLIAGLIVLALSVYAAWRIDKAQMWRLEEAYDIVNERKGDYGMPRQVVAAVCYQIKNDKIEFLLVRTKRGRRWTFPKGHVKRKISELHWVAAQREAREEAGADGSIEKEPFTCYLYRKGKKATEHVVAAHLLHVESKSEPDESYRKPKWFTLEKAGKKLAKKREKKYELEHKRVLEEAEARIRDNQKTGPPNSA